MEISNDCPYCKEPRLNFINEDGGIEVWIEKTFDGKHVISVNSSPYVLSIPINYCPLCGADMTYDD